MEELTLQLIQNMNLPTNYELITPEIAKMKPEGMKHKLKTDTSNFPRYNWDRKLTPLSGDFDRLCFSAPLGTTAMLTTEAPKAGKCNCSFSYLHGSPAHEVNCPAHPRNAMVLVLPRWLAENKADAKHVLRSLTKLWLDKMDLSAQWDGPEWQPCSGSDFWGNEDDGDYAYAVPRWVLDEIEGREKTCTCGKDYNDAFEGGYMQHDSSCPLSTQPESEVKTCQTIQNPACNAAQANVPSVAGNCLTDTKLWRVKWKSKITGSMGFGDLMTEQLADAWVKAGNFSHPELEHWMEIE